jgi:hypothetical protein
MAIMSKTDLKLDNLTKAIEKLIAKEVAPIAPIAPIAPVAPVLPIHTGDHDLLTKLDTKVDQIQLDVNELKKQNSIYVTTTDQAEVVRIQRIHDDEIKSLESFRDTLTGKMWGIGIMAGFGAGVLTLIGQYIVSHFH